MTSKKLKFKGHFFHSLPLIFITLVIFLYLRKAFFLPENMILYGGDLNDQFFWWKSFFVNNLKNGIIPFWNPYSFSGMPFLAHPSVSAFYPFNLIFFLFPYNLSFSIYVFVHLLLGGFFLYFFLKNYLDKISAFSGSMVFSLSGMFACRIYSGHIDIISTIVYIPLVFGLFQSLIRKPGKKTFLLACLSLALQILAGYQLVVMLTIQLILFFLAMELLGKFFKKKKWEIRLAVYTFLAIFLAIFLSAIQSLPTFQLVKESIRSQGLPYELATWGSYSFETFKLFVFPFSFGNPFPESYTYTGPGPNFFEISFYFGKIPLFLITLYVFVNIWNFIRGRKTDKLFLFFIISSLFFALVAMGRYFFMHKLLYTIFSPYKLFRFPSQQFIIVVFLLSSACAIAIGNIKDNFLKIAIITAIFVELFSYSSKFIRLSSIPTIGFDKVLVEQFKKNKDIARIIPNYRVVSQARKDLDFESYPYYRFFSTGGYNPIILKNYHRFMDVVNKSSESSVSYFNVEVPVVSENSPYFNFLNTKYLLRDAIYDANKADFSTFKLIQKSQRYNLYENQAFLTRFFLVNEVRSFQSNQEILRELVEKDIDLSKIIMLVKNDISTDFEKCDEIGEATVTKYANNKIDLVVNAKCDSFLSSSEVFYPGWKVKIDNKKTKLLKSNYAFKSIFVPIGEHEVEFYYGWDIYFLGALLSLTGVGMLLIILKKWR